MKIQPTGIATFTSTFLFSSTSTGYATWSWNINLWTLQPELQCQIMQSHVNSSFKFTCPQRVKHHKPTMFSNVCLQDSLEFNSSRSKGQASSKLHPLRSSWPKRVPQRRCLVWCNCWRARWTWTSGKWLKVMPWCGKTMFDSNCWWLLVFCLFGANA